MAVALSVVPGLGQVYNRQLRKAVFFVLATVATLIPAVLLLTGGEQLGRHLLEQRALAGFLALALGSVIIFLGLFVTGLFMWASAAVDARRVAMTLSNSAEEAGRWWFFRL